MIVKKKALRIFVYFVLIVAILAIVNSIPTWNLKTKNMNCIKGNWCNVYYETEKDAAVDTFNLADQKTAMVASKLGFTEKQDVSVYIYDYQKTMQQKKYGLIGPMLKLDWYIGDNIGTDVILTSPANPGPVHTYDSNKNAVLHEIIHAYISVENPGIHLWLTEGAALYLSNGAPFYKEYLNRMKIPSFDETKTRNPITFSNCGGYTFAHTYIEYLDKTYGWKKVCELLKSEDYNKVFNKTQLEIYDEWVSYINNYYQ